MKKLIAKYNFLRLSITVDGETHYVPSDRMLQEVFQTLPTIEDKERLCRNSNYFVKHIISSTYSDISVVENLAVWGICCSILGHSFEQYYRDDIAMSWYTILESPSNSPRVAYDVFSWFSDALEPSLNGKLIYGFDSITKKVKRNEAPAFRFKGFQEAWTFHEEVLINTHEGAKTDRELAILLQSWLLLQKKASYNRNLNNSIKIAITQCPYCGKQFEFDLGKGVSKRKPHCGANECEKKYDRLKPSKQKRTSKSDWKSAGSKRGRCKSCRKSRILDRDHNCKECYGIQSCDNLENW